MDNTTAETVANGLEKARRSGDGWTACCPAHDDKNPSLSITDGVDGRVLVKCHKGCSQEDVITELKGRGLWPERRNGKVVSVSQPYMGNRETTSKGVLRRYPYYRPDGVLHVEVCMYRDSATGKKVGRRPWREPSGVKAPHPLYRVRELPERPADPVLVVEGEHTVEHAAEHFPDYLVTTSIGGSSQAGETDWTPLADRAVVIWPDADAGGIEHAEKVSKLATAAGAASVRIVELPVLPAKWDLADPVPPGVDVRAILEHREELKSIRLDVVAKRIENLVNPLSWHRDRDPEPQEAMKLADANGRPALVAVEGGGQPEGATEATGFAPLPRRDKASLESALSQLGIDVRYNLRTSSHEWNRGGGWAPANDRVDDDIRELIAASFKIAHNERPALYGRERWVTSLNSILHGREVDPFRTWIEALPAWDKVERLSTWLGRAFRTNDDALSRWCSRYVFLGAVERTYKPGSKLDVLPVLVGPQGAGKSSVLALAFPEDRPEWFSDQLNLAADPKVRAEALQGVVMVEVAEMTGSTRAEIQSLKAFLSRTNDGGIRLAWRRNPEPMPRRCILIGTSNEAECLPNDWTGLRRFLVVEVDPHERGAAGAREVMLAERDMLWAEALHLHRGGAAARLPEELEGVQSAANEAHRSGDDVLEDALDGYLDLQPARQGFTLREVGKACLLCDVSGNVNQSNQRKLAGLLRARGFERVLRRIEGMPRRVWMRREV